MKKVFLFIMLLTFFKVSYASEWICTMDYTPVCAKVEVQCIKAPCEPVYQTFWNKCAMENNKLAKFQYDWECSNDNKVWMANPASVYCEKNWWKLDLESWNCTFENWKVCNEWDFFRWDCKKEKTIEPNKACTREYMPVCWQPKMPECPKGMMCMQVMPSVQTYSNKCVMESFWAEFVSNWSCESKVQEEPKICTMDYNPVCWSDGITYWNKCMAWDVKVSYKGECVSQKNQEKLIYQLDKVILNLEKNNSKKIYPILEKAIENIDKISENKNINEKKLNIFKFIKSYLQDYLNKNSL